MLEKIKSILVIEDDLAITDIYETIMKKANFNVETIGLGREAVRRIQEMEIGEAQKPDIILLDLILPDINGIEVLKEIKKHKNTADITVFILTNQESAELQKLDDAKPDKIIIKANITPTQLLEIIKKELS